MSDATEELPPSRKSCEACNFADNDMAKAYNFAGVARGGLVMSNFFLAAALIRLASDEAGCVSYDDDEVEAPECTNTVYGFRPSSLVTNIAVVTGVASALVMPVTGAVVDHTPHRRALGVLVSFVMVVIQAVQIGTVRRTWFAMAILQAVNGFGYQVLLLTIYAYLPEMSAVVGEERMNRFTALFMVNQFAVSLGFLFVVSGIGAGLGLDDVDLARVGQAVDVPLSGAFFVLAWRKFPTAEARHGRAEGRSLVAAGFSRLWRTTKGIRRHYGRSVGWFFVAVVFADAGFFAFSQVTVTYLVETLRMTGTEIGVVFAAVYVATVPGSFLGAYVTKRTNPVTSWRINIATFAVFTASGALVLSGPERANLTYAWAVLWGTGVGWHYPTENLIFSMCVPKGQEAELTGFYVYCTQILTFLPPLIFTVINESGIGMQWALGSLVIFFAGALVSLQLMEPWDEVVERAKTNKMKNEEEWTVATVNGNDA